MAFDQEFNKPDGFMEPAGRMSVFGLARRVNAIDKLNANVFGRRYYVWWNIFLSSMQLYNDINSKLDSNILVWLKTTYLKNANIMGGKGI